MKIAVVHQELIHVQSLTTLAAPPFSVYKHLVQVALHHTEGWVSRKREMVSEWPSLKIQGQTNLEATALTYFPLFRICDFDGELVEGGHKIIRQATF